MGTNLSELYCSRVESQGQSCICSRKTERFHAVLVSPTLSMSFLADFSYTSPSSLVLNGSIRLVCRQSFSLPEAATSPRTVFASGVPPPASASSTAHASPAARPSSPTSAEGWSETSLRSRLVPFASNPRGRGGSGTGQNTTIGTWGAAQCTVKRQALAGVMPSTNARFLRECGPLFSA